MAEWSGAPSSADQWDQVALMADEHANSLTAARRDRRLRQHQRARTHEGRAQRTYRVLTQMVPGLPTTWGQDGQEDQRG